MRIVGVTRFEEKWKKYFGKPCRFRMNRVS
jgi:hypothetical protein